MRANGAPYDNPDDSFDDSFDNSFDERRSDDYDLLDDLNNDEDEPKSARERAQRRTYRPRYRKPSRQPAAERESAFNAFLWLLDGATGVIEEMRHNDFGVPEECWVHADAARRESLMALRAVIDDWIDEDEPAPPAEAQRKTQDRRGGINIDF